MLPIGYPYVTTSRDVFRVNYSVVVLVNNNNSTHNNKIYVLGSDYC